MFKVTVMVINTNNPFELAGGQAPLPKNSPAPRNNTGGTYNGLMECPCTDTTVVKVPTLTYVFAHDAKRSNGAVTNRILHMFFLFFRLVGESESNAIVVAAIRRRL